MKTGKPSPLVPKRRFPEFTKDPVWQRATVAEIAETVTPPTRLTTSNYQSDGPFPIIDQSQSYICGWTNDADAIITSPLPVIIFGDHTCVLKFVDQPFAQGADGIKILTATKLVSTVYLYHQLMWRPVVMEEYKRHFSILKSKVVYFPDSKSGEQQKIADCLGSLDDLIAAEGRKLEALRQHKQGLMQQLFPRLGETVPRLRFPEFEDAPEWEVAALGTLLDRPPQYGVNAAAVPYSEALPTYIRITDIDDEGCFAPNPRVSVDVDPTDDQFLQPGDIVLARTGATVGKSYRYRAEDGPLVFAGFLIRVRPNLKRLVPEFLSAYLSTWSYWDWVRLTSARSGQPGINGSEYASMPLLMPTGRAGLPEQRRIADGFADVDAAIAAQRQRLRALRCHKDGLLQQLFPILEAK